MRTALRWFSDQTISNPIVVRVVQGASRRSRHTVVRSAYLAIVIIVLLFILLFNAGGPSASFRTLASGGANAFETVAYLQLALICILAPVFMAGAIAQESKPQIWDVLLTTPLNPFQIVLGVLAGRLALVLALLFSSLPLFAVTQYFGGVAGSSVLLSYVVTASAAILVGAIAVTLAVNRLATRRTVFSFYVSVITYLAITWVLDLQLRAATPWSGVTAATPLNPFLALRALLEPASHPTPDSVQLQSLSRLERFWYGSPIAAWNTFSLGLSFLLVLISTITVRTVGTRSSIPWWRRMFGLGARGARARPPRHVGHNPVAWRESTARASSLPKILARWAFIGAGILWGLGLVAAYHAGSIAPDSFRVLIAATIWTEILIITLVAVNMSSTAVSREREDGTLDLLLTTPITPRQYLGGKIRGLITFLLPLTAVPVLTAAFVSLYMLTGGLGDPSAVTTVRALIGTTSADVPLILPELALILPVILIPFLAFCIVIGLQWSLKSKGTIGAVVGAVGVLGITLATLGVCGWQAASSIAILGPALAAFTPFSATWPLVNPATGFSGILDTLADLTSARLFLAFGALAAAGAYLALVAAIRASMVRTFDVTTRRLAGNA
jgi:ABC-type transport system involved in multi-copper enzyme maturation permease subunit